jgi:tetratricopeptide (TPR) repeat protein
MLWPHMSGLLGRPALPAGSGAWVEKRRAWLDRNMNAPLVDAAVPLRVFYSYSHKDEPLREQLETHLALLGRDGVIVGWTDRNITAGEDWAQSIDEKLEAADIILLLLSPDFIASRYCWEKEGMRALERHNAGEARVIPVILRPVEWPSAQFAHLQALPKDSKAITFWTNRDEAWLDVTKGIRQAAKELTAIRAQQQRIATGLEQVRQNAAENSKSGLRAVRRRVVGERPSALIDHFKDRETQRNEISRLLANPSTRIVSVIGRGGMGKSALASRILAEMERNRWSHTQEEIPVDGIVYLSTRTNGINLGRLFEDCALMLGGDQSRRLKKVWESGHLTVRDKVERLLDEMGDGLYLILMDNMEDLLDDAGQITDDDLRTFFECSVRRDHSARLFVTSRIPLALPLEMMSRDRQITLLEGVPIPQAVEVLRELDPNNESKLLTAPPERLVRIAERLHGVPRALEIFAGMLRDDQITPLEDLLDRFYDERTVVDHLIKKAYKRLNTNARLVMQGLAVFGRPVKPVAVDFLLEPFTPGFDVPSVARRLVLKYLASADRESGTIWLHPIDREFAYSQISEKSAHNRRALERRAAEYYRQIRAPRERWNTIADLQPQLWEIEHLMRARDYDEAAEVLSEIEVEYLIHLGHARHVLALRTRLEGRIESRRLQLLHMFGLGCTYRFLGPVSKAIEYLQEAKKLADDRDTLRRVLLYLGEAYRRIGKLDDTISCIRQALATSPEGGDQREEMECFQQLGLAYLYKGNVRQALIYAELLMGISRRTGDIASTASAHDVFSLAYLVSGRWKNAGSHAEEGVRLFGQLHQHDTAGYLLNVQGLARFGERRVDEAIACFEQCRSLARHIDSPRLEGMCLFNLAYIQNATREVTPALENAGQATRLFSSLGAPETPATEFLADAIRASAVSDRAVEARALLACARSSGDQPDLHSPLVVAGRALDLAQAAGLPELVADAQAAIDQFRARIILPDGWGAGP